MCVFNRIKFGYFVSIFTLGTYAINGPIYAYYATATIQYNAIQVQHRAASHYRLLSFCILDNSQFIKFVSK